MINRGLNGALRGCEAQHAEKSVRKKCDVNEDVADSPADFVEQNLFTMSMWQRKGCLKEQIAASATRGKIKQLQQNTSVHTHEEPISQLTAHEPARGTWIPAQLTNSAKPQLETVVICYTVIETEVPVSCQQTLLFYVILYKLSSSNTDFIQTSSKCL